MEVPVLLAPDKEPYRTEGRRLYTLVLTRITDLLRTYGPGTGALGVASVASLVLSTLIPAVSSVVWAILLGLLSVTFKLPGSFTRGIDTYGAWVKLGVILTGAGVSFSAVWALGAGGLVLLGAKVLCGFFLAEGIGRLFKMPLKSRRLLGLGASVCGVSAILTAAPIIGAKEGEERGPVAAIIVFGALAVLWLPLFGHLEVFSPTAFGALAGLGVDNTAEALAVGYAFSPVAGLAATSFKLARNALLGVAVGATSLFSGGKTSLKETVVRTFPLFILGFLLLAGLHTTGLLSGRSASDLALAGRLAFLMAFAGLGATFRSHGGFALRRQVLAGLMVETSGFLLVLALVSLILG